MSTPPHPATPPQPPQPPNPPALVVLAANPGATVQDLGRPGLAHLGVGSSGAADRAAAALAHRLVGNPPDAAALEITLGGLTVRAATAVLLALTGAPAPARVDGRPVAHRARLALGAGEVLSLGMPPAGLRTYLAVRGGLVVEPLLGSRSTDTLSGIGPPPVVPGTVLPVGPTPVDDVPDTDHAPGADPPAPDTVVELAVLPGPRADRVRRLPGIPEDDLGTGAPGIPDKNPGPTTLLAGTWLVTAQANRVGTRLEPADPGGSRLAHRPGRPELASEGMVAGAVQVPPDGCPVVLGPDHPVTGGYPVVAVLVAADLDRLAQLRPGQRVRFVPAGTPGAAARRT